MSGSALHHRSDRTRWPSGRSRGSACFARKRQWVLPTRRRRLGTSAFRSRCAAGPAIPMATEQARATRPASGELQVAYVFGRETCIDLVAVLGLDGPDTSHVVSMRAGVECPPGDRYVTFEVASYCGLIPAASMIRAALSLSRSTNRVKSGCVMLIGSPPCFTSEARTPGSDRARAMSSASV